MPLTTVGDMRQHFLNIRYNSSLKRQLGVLTQELATGRVADLTAHLGADQTRLADIDRQLTLAQGYRRATTQTGQVLSVMQTSLDRLETLRGTAAAPLIGITPANSLTQQQVAASEARLAFEGMVQTLNTRFGDKSLFGGAAVTATPLTEASVMLGDMLAQAGAATDVAGVIAALDSWFDDPGGGFQTMGYGGSTANLRRPVGQDDTIEIGARADDPALRTLLKSAALGAIATDPGLTLSQEDRADLLRYAGEGLMSSAAGLSGLQADLGVAEARVERAATRNAAHQTALGIMRNDLVGADPFQTAAELEQVQLQLETHYTLTARLSRLSLTEYLR